MSAPRTSLRSVFRQRAVFEGGRSSEFFYKTKGPNRGREMEIFPSLRAQKEARNFFRAYIEGKKSEFLQVPESRKKLECLKYGYLKYDSS